MKALREAKACLSNPDVHPMAAVIALQHLVDAVDGGILTFVTRDTGAGAIYDKRLTQPGQRVRVLAVGEQP